MVVGALVLCGEGLAEVDWAEDSEDVETQHEVGGRHVLVRTPRVSITGRVCPEGVPPAIHRGLLVVGEEVAECEGAQQAQQPEGLVLSGVRKGVQVEDIGRIQDQQVLREVLDRGPGTNEEKGGKLE